MALPARLTIYCATQDLKLESWDSAGPIGGVSTQVEHPVLEHANAILRRTVTTPRLRQKSAECVPPVTK